jgi:undecaprenyl-diphosphatase
MPRAREPSGGCVDAGAVQAAAARAIIQRIGMRIPDHPFPIVAAQSPLDRPPAPPLDPRPAMDFQTLLAIVLLGIVEGVTEFIPVSSTGHLILASELLGYDPAQWAVFNVVIQLGAILAVIVLYRRVFMEVLLGLFGRDPAPRKFVRNILLAFLPSAVLGLAFHRQIEAMLGSSWIVAWALILGGLAIIAIEYRHKRSSAYLREAERIYDPDEHFGAPEAADIVAMSWRTALGIGAVQCLSMIPGVSRSGATIMGAVSLGVERRTAAVFSFFLAIPTMIGASTLELVKNYDHLGAANPAGIAIGFAVSFVVAIIVIRLFIAVVSRMGFTPFAWYRIVAGGLALLWLA